MFRSNFQLLMLGPNLLKPPSPMGVGVQIQLSTFDAKFRSAKSPKSHFLPEEGGGGQIQLSIFDAESNSAKIPKIHR